MYRPDRRRLAALFRALRADIHPPKYPSPPASVQQSGQCFHAWNLVTVTSWSVRISAHARPPAAGCQFNRAGGPHFEVF
ncbi:unnamed protein product [Penicillium roqueforti FM164]|uniref:Genomic scaffold, ProqFM164S03 n=1 Tax=Penicillium roqueforti (strain FM164) TaxID=1365484 RepID=W6QGF2_PENRF|nr:unnamed protein product [Penicillium roqueforti FM164]